MIDSTPFLQFVAPRVRSAMRRVEGEVWRMLPDALPVRQATPTHEHLPASQAETLEFRPVETSGGPFVWGRKWQQAWWRVTIPAGSEGRYLQWRDQGEATVYRRDGDGWTPHHGIDPGHLIVPLPDDVDSAGGEVLIESICARTAVWVVGQEQGISEHGSEFRGASLAVRDEDAWGLWHDFDTLVNVARTIEPQLAQPNAANNGDLWTNSGYRAPVEVASPLFRRILHGLEDAVAAYEREGPAAGRAALAPLFKQLKADAYAMRHTLTGHAHIDLVWKWPERIGDFKAVHSFATVEHLMDRYPELYFGYSQPASYEAVEKRSVSLMQRVRSRIKSGRWEATGAMYVESDTQLPVGEALVRSIELGQAGFRDLSGEESPVLWLPDVFGYSACLPQLLKGFGVPYFFTTKLHWSSATKFPHSAFRWQGHDGSEVLGFIAWEHYNLVGSPHEMKWAADNQRQSGIFNEALVPVGYGDGGGGPTETMCERVRRMSDLASMPKCEWGRIDKFFERMSEVQSQLPRWRGEMYLEYHRGVQTTHSHLKAAYRAAERGLQAYEAVQAVTGGGPIDDQPWKRTVFAQFHDYLPGSSVQEVYDEGVPELQGVADSSLAAAKGRLAGEGEAALFNPLPMERIELIDGQPRRLAPLAGASVASLEVVASPDVTADSNSLSNGRVSAHVDKSGHLTRMAVDGVAIDLPEPGGLVWFDDKPAMYDAWDIDRPTLSYGHSVGEPIDSFSEGDATRRVLGFRYKAARKSTATVRYILERGSPVLKIEVETDWQDPQTLLKFTVPTPYAGEAARYGAPFGSVLRPQMANTIGDDARFENPLSRWMCVGDGDGDGGHGLTLVTEAKYGAGVRDGLFHLSILRSAHVTDANDNPQLRDWDAYGGSGHQQFSDLGVQTTRFALGRWDSRSPRHEQPAALAESLYTPPISYTGPAVSSGLLGLEGCPTLIPTWAKPVDGNTWILRLNETLGRRGSATLRLAEGWGASLVDLRGNELGKLDGGQIEVTPNALLSVRLTRSA